MCQAVPIPPPGADPKGQGAGFSTQARKLENEPQIN